MSIQSNFLNITNNTNNTNNTVLPNIQRAYKKNSNKQLLNCTPNRTLNQEDFTQKIDMSDNTKKIKYVSTDDSNFEQFFSFGNKMGQNYDMVTDNNLHFSEETRRRPPPELFLNNNTSENPPNTSENPPNTSENPPNTPKIGAKQLKESDEYWDNTKRHNLDTSFYTNNPNKMRGRGFGEINKYDLYLNGIGVSTRQLNPETNPRNIDNDRMFMTNHNYNYDKFHVTESLPCGQDTRYLNKKMV